MGLTIGYTFVNLSNRTLIVMLAVLANVAKSLITRLMYPLSLVAIDRAVETKVISVADRLNFREIAKKVIVIVMKRAIYCPNMLSPWEVNRLFILITGLLT